MMTPEFLHYFSAIIALSLGGIGGGIGQGIAGLSVIQSLTRQPTGNDSEFKAMVIGLALIESGIILALVITLMLLFREKKELTLAIGLSELGIGLAIGCAAAAISIASSFIVKASCHSIARQPFFAQKIITVMLLVQSIIEAPLIFAFIVSLLIRGQLSHTTTIFHGLKNLAAGLTIGLGSIGPSIGQAIFGYAACTSIGLNKNAYNKIFPFTLLSQVVIETPMIFCLLIAFIIIYTPISITESILQSAALVTAACTIGLGALGTSIGIGYASAKSCYQIAYDPTNYPLIIRTTLLIEAFIESAVIYAMIVAFLLVLKVS